MAIKKLLVCKSYEKTFRDRGSGFVVEWKCLCRKNKIDSILGCHGYYWDPQKNIIDLKCFNDVDSIINLSGASIFRIWTKKNKELILNSRVQSLNFLRDTINENNIKINSIISASGIGAYPSSNEKEFDETEKDRSNYFLSDVIKEWEKATMSFKNFVKNSKKKRKFDEKI